jgi:hypothetical protein
MISLFFNLATAKGRQSRISIPGKQQAQLQVPFLSVIDIQLQQANHGETCTNSHHGECSSCGHAVRIGG